MTSKPSSDNRIPNPDQPINQTQSWPTHSSSKNVEAGTEQKRVMVNRAVLLILVVVVLFVLVPMLKIFLTPLILACTFASLFFPFYTVLLKFFRGNRVISALACCFILVLGLVVPVYLLGYLVTHQ
jgi:predicted PurR-regulated permease PerM